MVNKTNFHMKSFALSLALIMRFTMTRKRPIVLLVTFIMVHCFSISVSVDRHYLSKDDVQALMLPPSANQKPTPLLR